MINELHETNLLYLICGNYEFTTVIKCENNLDYELSLNHSLYNMLQCLNNVHVVF